MLYVYIYISHSDNAKQGSSPPVVVRCVAWRRPGGSIKTRKTEMRRWRWRGNGGGSMGGGKNQQVFRDIVN